MCAYICVQGPIVTKKTSAEVFVSTQNPPLSLISIIPSIHALCNSNKVMAAFMASYLACCELFCNLSSDWRLITQHTFCMNAAGVYVGTAVIHIMKDGKRKKKTFSNIKPSWKIPFLHSLPYRYLQAGIIMIKDEPGYTAVDPTV